MHFCSDNTDFGTGNVLGQISEHVLGPVPTYPDIFESATFSYRIQKFPRPRVSDGIRIHSSTQGSSALKCPQSMRRRAR